MALVRGPAWSFVAWNSAGGVCVGYAAGTATNGAVGCGPWPNRSDEDPHTPNYLLTLLMKPDGSAAGDPRGAADKRGAIMGAVTPEVARVTLEMADGRRLEAVPRTVPSLDTPARLFIVREHFDLSADGARAVAFYDASGRLLERFPIG